MAAHVDQERQDTPISDISDNTPTMRPTYNKISKNPKTEVFVPKVDPRIKTEINSRGTENIGEHKSRNADGEI